MSALVEKLDDKMTNIYVMAILASSTMLASSNALAAADSFDDYKKANGGDKSLLSQDGTGAVESSVKGFINIIKWIGLMVGVVLVIGGLLTVKKATASNGQQSPMVGWMTVLIGGLMTIAATIAVVLGRSAEGLAGVK